MERNAETGRKPEAEEIGLLKYFSLHVILFRTLPSGKYVIRAVPVTNEKGRNRTIERVWVGCFIHITVKTAQDGKCVSRQYCVTDQFFVRF